MEAKPMPVCAHDWQPIPNWYARYRCSICHVIGVKLVAVAPREAGVRRTEIQPYRCGATCRGQPCGAPAVHSGAGKKFRCAEHGHGAHASRVRRAMPAIEEKAPAAPVLDDPSAETR